VIAACPSLCRSAKTGLGIIKNRLYPSWIDGIVLIQPRKSGRNLNKKRTECFLETEIVGKIAM